jgi:uncharacterized protein (TIGR02611 family)
MTAERGRPKLIERLAERREAHLRRGRPYRILFTIAGAIVLLGGLVMLVAPGPALVVIPIGLAMLAMEFAWAERMLEKAIIQADAARDKAREASPRDRVLTGLAFAAGAAALVALVLYFDLGPF